MGDTALEHYAGDKTLAIKDNTRGFCKFGGDKNEYRYTLSREWDSGDGRVVMFVMMNPSTATGEEDDRTIAKCTKYAKRWGYSGLIVCNTFAYRCTDQRRLGEVTDPVGPYNDIWIKEAARLSDKAIFAYGKPKIKELGYRGPQVVELVKSVGLQPFILKLNTDGTPCHPLYLPDNLHPLEWNQCLPQN